jgi:hypothetical protein
MEVFSHRTFHGMSHDQPSPAHLDMVASSSQPPIGAVRRSGRTSKRPPIFGEKKEISEKEAAKEPAVKRTKVIVKRNPPREAVTAAPKYSFPVPNLESVHEETFAPLAPKELEEWRGWCSVESEPVGAKSDSVSPVWLTHVGLLQFHPVRAWHQSCEDSRDICHRRALFRDTTVRSCPVSRRFRLKIFVASRFTA